MLLIGLCRWLVLVCVLTYVYVLLITACTAFVVLEFGLNAYCVGEIRSCFSRYAISWLLMIVSKSLAIIGSSEIGL